MKKKPIRIIGIDPGSVNLGFGIIDGRGCDPEYLTHGVLRMKSQTPLFKRLALIYEKLESLITEYNPEVLAIEQVFNHKNVKSTVILAHARAIALMAAGKYSLKLAEYSPRQVKLKVTGSGSAEKERVKKMTTAILNIKEKKIPLDASDALAIALCYHFQGESMTSLKPKRKNSVWTIEDIKNKGLKFR